MDIPTILSRYRKIAVVGLSPSPSRPSHEVTEYMIDEGYEVTGVRPGPREILGRPCYPTLRDLPEAPEIVNVFRAPEHVPGVVEDAIAVGARVLWLQEGIAHPEAERRAREAGLEVVSDRCILQEHRRWKSTA
jgi:predicted CoA-binding protein